jgi:superfamily II DNA/RNA helicase
LRPGIISDEGLDAANHIPSMMAEPPFLLLRAGRAARAGRLGRVFTLLRPEDVRHFKQMLHKADNTFVRDYRYSASTDAA